MTKKILILEDDKDIARICAKLLKSRGYDVTVAHDGLEGLEKLHQLAPDLILMDVSMPKMSGVGFYQNICGSDGKPTYPLIVMTGRMDLEMTFQNLPVEGILLKPFERKQLLQKVEMVFQKDSCAVSI
jgi:DNA-binding response OmpR family regulator